MTACILTFCATQHCRFDGLIAMCRLGLGIDVQSATCGMAGTFIDAQPVQHHALYQAEEPSEIQKPCSTNGWLNGRSELDLLLLSLLKSYNPYKTEMGKCCRYRYALQARREGLQSIRWRSCASLHETSSRLQLGETITIEMLQAAV